MPAPIQPTTIPSPKTVSTATREDAYVAHNYRTNLASLESRENTLRNAVKKWFGPLEMIDPTARAHESSRHEAMLNTLCRLHRLSSNLVVDPQRLPLTEQDIFSAILILNRISITVKCPAGAIVAYCESRAVREENPRLNQLDPLQLRHLLTFHQDIPHEELNALDIRALKRACENNAKDEIHLWFEAVTKRKNALPLGAPQFLRQLITELWTSGNRDFVETIATELTVLDCAMFDVLGWENSRLFLSIFKRLHGSHCRPASAYMDAEEINVAVEMYKQLGDSDQVVHFRALSTTFDANSLRRLEHTILAASKERGSRISVTRNRPSPVELKKSVQYVTSADIPTIFARKNLSLAN
jgi:hypothetical protein